MKVLNDLLNFIPLVCIFFMVLWTSITFLHTLKEKVPTKTVLNLTFHYPLFYIDCLLVDLVILVFVEKFQRQQPILVGELIFGNLNTNDSSTAFTVVVKQNCDIAQRCGA